MCNLYVGRWHHSSGSDTSPRSGCLPWCIHKMDEDIRVEVTRERGRVRTRYCRESSIVDSAVEEEGNRARALTSASIVVERSYRIVRIREECEDISRGRVLP
jgi:hypothetical protein